MYSVIGGSILIVISLVLLPSQILSLLVVDSASSLTTLSTSTNSMLSKTATSAVPLIVRIPRHVWRPAAIHHQDRVRQLLEPTLVPHRPEYQQQQPQQQSLHQQQGGRRRRKLLQEGEGIAPPRNANNNNNNNNNDKEESKNNYSSSEKDDDYDDQWFRPLDPRNPVCNFLIEYYGLKGHQGVKRLARWSPSPNLLLLLPRTTTKGDDVTTLFLTSLQDLEDASSQSATATASGSSNGSRSSSSHHHHHHSGMANSGVFLEDVTMDDFATLLHLRGAILQDNGALYSPGQWFDVKQQQQQQQQQQPETSSQVAKCRGVSHQHPASAYLWFRSILQQTLQAEPILHCHGLHEMAMMYCPNGAAPPPSAKYQQHLALRVSQDVINQTVERKGISCTHVDALRFFAPAAGPLNHHGASLQRMDQLRLEQPACVHAHMDLLKIGLRLQPFCDAALMRRILQLSMDARRLDVAASPYDATAYGVGIVAIETKHGRAQYRRQQRELMERAEPIRRELLDAYNLFLRLAFDEDPVFLETQVTPSAERYATAQPGSKPWRQNLMSYSPSNNSL
jgi:hypothetical protein